MRNVLLVGGILIVLMIGAGWLLDTHPAAPVPEATPTAAPATNPHAAEAGYPYPPEVEASFKRSFANSPGMGDCALKATERRYSYDDYLSVAHTYAGTNDLPPSIKAIVVACALSLQ